MADIRVTKINEAYVQVHTDDRGILQELSDHFTFFIPGAQFSPQFKMKAWDGKIRLFNIRNQTIYRGLFPRIIDFATERKYTIAADDDIKNTNNFSVLEAQEYIKTLKIRSGGVVINPHDFQIEAFCKSIRNKRKLILSPTGSGKSLIDYLLIRRFIDEGKRGMIICPTTNLIEQLYSDFKDYSSENGWDVAAHVHKLYSGQDKNVTKPVLLTTWQSIFKNDPKFFKGFKFVIGEEVHLHKAKSLVSIMTNCVNAEYRIGLTGTLDGSKTHQLVLEGLYGSVSRVATTKNLTDRKILAELNIKCLVLKYPDKISKMAKDFSYNEERMFINSCRARNVFIRNLALSLKGTTLVLFRHVETHGQIIYEAIKEKIEPGRNTYFVHGGTDVEDRETIRKLMETEEDVIVNASVGVFSTGINSKKVRNIIFVGGGKSKIQVLQSIGRALRISATKTKSTLFDIVDDMRYGSRTNFSVRHFEERIKMYDNEGFPYSIYNIDLKV